MTLSPLEQVANYVSEGRCALFVGPDLGESDGIYRGLPTSWQLAYELANLCNYRGRLEPLPQMAQIFASQKQPIELKNYLRQRLGAPEERPLPVHELIARIPFPVIVSGGWDTLLEQALTEQQIPFRVVYSDRDLAFAHPGQKQLIVYKLYGSIDRPDSLIVTKSDQVRASHSSKLVMAKLKVLMAEYALLLVGYAPAQDELLTSIYYEIHDSQAHYQVPAFAVQSLQRAEEAKAWQAQNIQPVVQDPVPFLRQLAQIVAQAQGRQLVLPDLKALPAPKLTPKEVKQHEKVLNDMMNHIGVADLVEQTNVPLLNQHQLRDVEVMRAAYERLMQSFSLSQSDPRSWLLQGNLEYARKNYRQAEKYYEDTLKACSKPEADSKLEANPNVAEAHYNLHYVQLAQKKWSKALSSYQQAIDLRPDLAILPARYQVKAILGGGETGIVYRAQDTKEKRLVAIKVLDRAKAQTQQRLHVFKREAKVLQGLDHPNIVKMLGFGDFQGHYFIIMEYLEGQSVQETLQERSTPFSLDQTFELIEQVCQALIEAHAADIIHRDVKPSNIFLVGEQARLIHFSLALPLTANDSTSDSMTESGRHLAPEQAMGDIADQRTDVYGVGSVFYEMLTGLNPSEGTYRPPSELRSGLNSALDLVIETAREQDPEDRYPTVDAFCNELRQVVVMQAASVRAPWTLRLMGRMAQVAQASLSRGWPVWLGAIAGLGFILPELSPMLREVGRYLAAAVAITFLLGIVARPFTMALARRVRSALIAAYGSLVGLTLGVVNSLLWLRGFSFECALPQKRLGYVEMENYLIVLVSSLALSLIVATTSFFFMSVAGLLTQRLGRRYTTGFSLSYLLLIGVLLLLGISQPFGWFADASDITRECLERLNAGS